MNTTFYQIVSIMKKQLSILFLFLGLSFTASAQLPNGSIAPDFTLTDRDGVTHHLYSYLAEGKVVFIKFFACHCPGCWSYHQTGKLESLHQTYGPDGTDQIVVIMLEHDQNNPEAFSGGGTYTQGDWEAGNTVPMVDVEGTDRTVFDDYNLNYYPMVMKVCSDKTTELMSTNYTVQELFDEADDCAGNLSLNPNELNGAIYFNASLQQIVLDGFNQIESVSVYNSIGQQVMYKQLPENQTLNTSELTSGLFIVKVHSQAGTLTEKIIIN